MKIWNFEGNGNNYISEVYEILKKYSDGLNTSQSVLISNIDVIINDNSEAVYLMRLDNGYSLMSCLVKFDGTVNLEINYYKEKGNYILKIGEIEPFLDEVIKSNKMGSLLSFLMRVKEKSEKNTIFRY